ncbi:MAG: tetratricopeptide repeat protein [Chitinispirillaceae bacterium]|nr:tetratricopeptide repeat protein [Chitinispirillaceae bacterium]
MKRTRQNEFMGIIPENPIKKCPFLSGTLLLLLLGGCASHRFPVVRPVVEPSRNVYARTKAQDHFILARDFDRRGLVKLAEREYERALQLDSGSDVLKKLLFQKYLESGKYTQALLLIKGGRKNEALTREEKRMVSTIYIKMEEFTRAVGVLESIRNKNEEELFSIGRIYEVLGNSAKALDAYRRYFEKKPDALAIGFRVAKMLLQQKRYSEAESLLVVIQEREGPQGDIYTLRGTVALMDEDTVRALGFYDSALAVDSLHEEALRSKAQVYIGRADFPPAIECYRKLIGSEAYGEVYGRTLALLYFYNGQIEESEQLFKDLLQENIDDYELHYYLGLVFADREKNEFARTEFEKALALQPKHKESWRELCSVALRDKDYRTALQVARRFTTALPDEASSWRMQGYVESILKKYPAAIKSFRKAVALDTADSYGWFELGSALERNKEIDRAVKAFRKVLVLRPDDPATLNYLGYMWAEQGKHLDTAKAYLERALEQEPNNGAFLDSYAWVYFRLGEFDSAFVYLQKAIERIYDDPVLYDHLGDILVERKDLNGAVDAYHTSLELGSEDGAAVRRKILDLEIIIQRQGITLQ